MRIAPSGILSRLAAILDGPRVLPPSLKVHRQLHRKLFGLVSIGRRESLPKPSVQANPLGCGYPLVNLFLIQRVQEGIAGRYRSIRPFHRPARTEELPTP